MQIRYIDEVTWQFDHELGQRLRDLRSKHKHSLHDIEDMTGIKMDRIARMERGDSRARMMDIMKLSKIYGVAIMEILEGLWDFIEIND